LTYGQALAIDVKLHLSLEWNKLFLAENSSVNRAIVTSTACSVLDGMVMTDDIYDFKVVCDQTNNLPGEDKIIVDVYVKPKKVVQFVHMSCVLPADDGYIMGRKVCSKRDL
jgi:hypothetical protein